MVRNNYNTSKLTAVFALLKKPIYYYLCDFLPNTFQKLHRTALMDKINTNSICPLCNAWREAKHRYVKLTSPAITWARSSQKHVKCEDVKNSINNIFRHKTVRLK